MQKTYVINSKLYELKQFSQKITKAQERIININQPFVSERLARLERYYKEEKQQNEKLVHKVGSVCNSLMYIRTPNCRCIGQYLAIVTKLNITIWKLSQKAKEISYKPFREIDSSDQISSFDLKINNDPEIGIDVLFATKNPNGIFAIHLNSYQRKIDFNENIHGVAFLNDQYILFRLQKQFCQYTYELLNFKNTMIQFPKQQQPNSMVVEDFPTVLKICGNRIFFAYTHKVESNYFVILEQFKLQQGNQKTHGVQRIVASSSKLLKMIQNMLIIKNKNSNDSDYLEIYILLQNEIIFLKQKQLKQNQRKQNDNQKKHFFTVECSIQPPRSQQIVSQKNSDKQENENEKETTSDNVFLLETNNENNKDKKDLKFLYCQYKTNKCVDPSTIQIFDIQSNQQGKDSLCSLNYKLSDIIFADNFGPNSGKVIYSFTCFGRILFVIHSKSNHDTLYLMQSYKISYKQKIKQLMPKGFPDKQSDDIISQKRMQLLIKFYSIYSLLQEQEDKKKSFFKQFWEKIKQLAFKKNDNRFADTQSNKNKVSLNDRVGFNQQTSNDKFNKTIKANQANKTVFDIIGKKNIVYLYNTEDIQYIGKQMKQLIQKIGKIPLTVLRTYYQNIKRISSQKIIHICNDRKIPQSNQKNEYNNNNFQEIPLAEYLKSVFYLKKIDEFDNDRQITQIDYQRWKKRKATQFFYQNWGQQTKITAFIKRHYGFLIFNYEQILKQIIENYTNFNNSKQQFTWRADFANLLMLLPQYPSESKLKEIYEHQKQINKQNNFNIMLPIDYLIEFPNITHVRQQTTYEDITSQFTQLSKDQIKQFEKYLKQNYMRNNDFLFIDKKELDDKLKKLSQEKGAVYIFLQLMRQKIKQKNKQNPIGDQQSVLNSQSEKQSELSLNTILLQLKNRRHINNNDYFKLNIGIEMYELALNQQNLKNLGSLSKFLELDVLNKIQTLLLNQQYQSNFKKIEVFKGIWEIWKKYWTDICMPGDKYFRYVLGSEQSQCNIHLDNFNNKEQIQSLIFESVFKRYFLQGNSYMEAKKLNQLFQLIKMIQLMSEDDKQRLKLLIEFLLQSIFEKVSITKNNKQNLNEIQKLLCLINKQKKECESFQQYSQYKYQTIKDKKKVLKLICKNFHIFEQFRLKLTINNLRRQNDNYYQQQKQQYSEQESQFLNYQNNNNNSNNTQKLKRTKSEIDFNFNQRIEENETTPKWLREVTKIQIQIIKNQYNTTYQLFKVEQQQQSQQSQQYPTDTLNDIFKLEKQFIEMFNVNQDDTMINMLMQNFFRVTLQAAYNNKLHQKYNIQQLIQIQINRNSDNNKDSNPISHDEYMVQQENILQKIIKEFVNVAKQNNQFEFILQCIRILKIMNDNNYNQYTSIQQMLVLLKKKNFKPQQVSEIKKKYYKLVMKISSSTDPARRKELQQNYIIYMAQYIDETINKIFSNGLPSYESLEVVMTQFPKTYFFNHQAHWNKAYEPDYLIIKLLICAAEKYKNLPQNFAHVIKTMQSVQDGYIGHSVIMNNKEKIQSQINPDLLRFLSGYYKTIDLKNFTENIKQKWKIFTTQDYKNSDGPVVIQQMQMNEADIRIYSYFSQYIKKIEYYMLGKMLQNQKKIHSDEFEQNGSPNQQEQSNERTLRTNMIFLVRYWKELKFDLDKVILLIKISLDDPIRFQYSKQQSIKEVCLMLANLIQDNKYIYVIKTTEQLESLCKTKKNFAKDSKSQSDALIKKMVAYLEQFIVKLKSFKVQKSTTTTRNDDNHQIVELNGNSRSQKTRIDKKLQNRHRDQSVQDEDQASPKKDQSQKQKLQFYFQPQKITQFISKVQNQIASRQYEQKQQYSDFNLQRFRIFVTCIKFDRKLTNLFEYNFFKTKQRCDPKQIFQTHLSKKVKQCLEDSRNNEKTYLHIGKALRYGFNNNIEMELSVTKLYLQILINRNKQRKRKEEEKQCQQKMKEILDMMDAEIIKYDFVDMKEILKQRGDFLEKYLLQRGITINK